jgi:hypothetical protein
MKTFEFATPHGKIGMMIMVPGSPPEYYWSGRIPCPDEVRDQLTKGLTDPENGRRVAGDKGEDFLEVLQLEYARGRHLAGRRGPMLKELPKGARKIPYTPGVANLFAN